MYGLFRNKKVRYRRDFGTIIYIQFNALFVYKYTMS